MACEGQRILVGSQGGALYSNEEEGGSFRHRQAGRVEGSVESLLLFRGRVWVGQEEGRLSIHGESLETEVRLALGQHCEVTHLVLHEGGGQFYVVAGDSLGCLHWLDEWGQLLVSVCAHTRALAGLLSHYGALTSLGEEGYLTKWQYRGGVELHAESRQVSHELVRGCVSLWDKYLLALFSRRDMLITE